jgi:hypothetical protein
MLEVTLIGGRGLEGNGASLCDVIDKAEVAILLFGAVSVVEFT